MEIYALVGPSGSGKSHRAGLLTSKYNIPLIIDDGLLIKGRKILAGSSAKKEESKMAAIRRALFYDRLQVSEVKEALRNYPDEKLLIIGTSKGMIEKIIEHLDLPEIDNYIDIREIATEDEIERAKTIRKNEGKHVIPVPLIEVEPQFPGYLLNSLDLFFKRGEETVRHEKSIVRPRFSFYGNLIISNRVLIDLINYFLNHASVLVNWKKVKVNKEDGALKISFSLSLAYGGNLHKIAKRLQRDLKLYLEEMTGLTIENINIEIYTLDYTVD